MARFERDDDSMLPSPVDIDDDIEPVLRDRISAKRSSTRSPSRHWRKPWRSAMASMPTARAGRACCTTSGARRGMRVSLKPNDADWLYRIGRMETP